MPTLNYNPFDSETGEAAEARRIETIADLRRYVLTGRVNGKPEQEKRPAGTGLGDVLWR